MNPEESPWREKYRVRLGAAAGIVFIWRAQPTSLVFLFSGLLLGSLGILLRQWAAGCLMKNDELATKGPYAIVRNPLYLGSFVAAAGLMLAATSFAHPTDLRRGHVDRTLFFWAILWIFIDSVYMPKIRKEAALLRARFGAEYDAYAERVPALFPRLSRQLRPNFSTFSVELWKKNEEYWSLVGFAFICVILIFRFHYAR
ncbi:MAG: hypothetical protein A3A86_03660 [Elusimicrobia bacterium RIFCSPLOWO2_01_FULL_60_11]|nr:MAG: hypothetical protein A3A86_03660 [Elusimicrobia bacterium RIFCSPLOWO2_01_FULL_60_11]